MPVYSPFLLKFTSVCDAGLYKYSQAIYDALMLAFDALPIAAVLEGEDVGKFLAMHGGIGPDIKTVCNKSLMRNKPPLVKWVDTFS